MDDSRPRRVLVVDDEPRMIHFIRLNLEHDGYEVVEASMPALVTVSSEIGELRKLNIKQMRETRKRPIHVWTARDLSLDPMPEKHLNLERLYAPERSRKCTFIEAGSLAEAGERLASKLREDDVI